MSLPDVSPGSRAFPAGNSITLELGTDSAEAGDAVTIGADGTLVTTTGSNGFLGVLGSHRDSQYTSGNEVTVHTGSVAKAAVSATVGGSVSAGEALEAGSGGTLTNIDSGDGTPADADAGDVQALSDEDADGYALVLLG